MSGGLLHQICLAGLLPSGVNCSFARDQATAINYSTAELQVVLPAQPDVPDAAACWSQKEPAHKLINLAGIPILLVASEASHHSVYDHCTARYFDQAGVKNTFLRLADRGIHGNGHMMMLGKNNLEIAKLLDDSIRANID